MKEYDGFLVDDDLNIYSSRTKNKLTKHMGSDGYEQVMYRDKNNKFHHQRVHVILANCFIDNPNNYKYINHKDNNKMNNSLDNLEWCTNSYNVFQSWHDGNFRHKQSTKLKVEDLKHNHIENYKSIRECGKSLHLDRHKIARVLKGELKEDYLGYLFSYI